MRAACQSGLIAVGEQAGLGMVVTLSGTLSAALTGGILPTPEGMARRTTDIPIEHLAQMQAAKARDGIGDATRIRAMVQVWAEDPEVRSRVEQLAAASLAAWTATRQQNAAKARSARWPRKS